MTPVAVTAIPSRVERVAVKLVRRWCGWRLRRHAHFSVEGMEHIPSNGPVLLACRHVHYMYDGCLLQAGLPRPVHLLITLDWMPVAWFLPLMERVCALVRWPVVPRASVGTNEALPAERSPNRASVRRAIRRCADVLAAGDILAVFPEGYPNVDPVYTPKRSLSDMMDFLPGFVTIVDLAGARRRDAIPVVPVGFAYERGERWTITMRCGPPLYRHGRESRDEFADLVRARVMALSEPR